MSKFRDNAGREWDVLVDVEALRRVREGLGLNLVDVLKPGGAAQLEDPVRLVDALYLVLRPAVERAGVTDEDFGRGLTGQAIDDAAGALIEGLAAFLPPARGALVRKAAGHVRAVDAALARAVSDRLDAARDDALRAAAAAAAPTVQA